MFEVTTSEFMSPDEGKIRENTFFLYRHLWNPEGVIVFVHGLGGSPFETWKKFPQLAFEDTELGMFDVGLFKYDTKVLRWGMLTLKPVRAIHDIAEELTDIVRDHLGGYRHISFVTHSLGGIVAKFGIRRIIEFYPDRVAQIHSLFLIGTPNYGSAWASYIPRPLLFLFSAEMACLKIFSPGLDQLQVFWNTRVRSDPADAPGRVLIRERAIISGKDRYVERGSGVGSLPDPFIKRVPKAHTRLPKPLDDKDDVYLYIKRNLADVEVRRRRDQQGDRQSRQQLRSELEDRVSEFFHRMRRMAELYHEKDRLIREGKFEIGGTFDQTYEVVHREVEDVFVKMRAALRDVWENFPDGEVRPRIRDFADWYHKLVERGDDIDVRANAPGPQHLSRIIQAIDDQIGAG